MKIEIKQITAPQAGETTIVDLLVRIKGAISRGQDTTTKGKVDNALLAALALEALERTDPGAVKNIIRDYNVTVQGGPDTVDRSYLKATTKDLVRPIASRKGATKAVLEVISMGAVK